MNQHHNRTLLVLSISALAGCALGCSDSGGDGIVEQDPGFVKTELEAALTRTQSCGELLDGFHADGIAKIEIQTANLLRWYVDEEEGQQYASGLDDAGGFANESSDASPSADGAGRAAGPENYSETNTQVKGVDEADIVKTDGHNLYVLSGSKLFVVKSWPAEDTALKHGIDIDGYTNDMFVTDGRAVVFSNVEDPAYVKPAFCETTDEYRYECYGRRWFTKATVVDSIGDQPQKVRELYFEGHYNSSRRHDDQVRLVLSNYNDYYYWEIPRFWDYLNDIESQLSGLNQYYWDKDKPEWVKTLIRNQVMAWRKDAIAAMKATVLTDWVPRRYEQMGSVLTEIAPDCNNFYLNDPGLVDYGMTQVAGFDLGKPNLAPSQVAIQGFGNQVYANHDVLLINQWDWSGWYRAYLKGEKSYSTVSVLHRFELGETGKTAYQGSGELPGTINDQFSVDEKDGIVRVATTQTTWPIEWDENFTRETWNYVATLQPNKNQLDLVGQSDPLAKDESIQSARFMGDMAYIVTFRQVDPLFAIDLTDPKNPEVLGELKIPGFSTYMHPLDEGHLLTIGFDADEETGWREEMILQIFDVTDPTAPELKHKHSFSDEWGHSEAAWNHKAFTFYGHLDMLAFPYAAYGNDWNDYRTSLELFEVTTDKGFNKVGSVDHAGLGETMCGDFDEDWEKEHCTRSYTSVRRGVFIEDYVYSISYGGIRVNVLDDMEQDVATVELPIDGIQNHYYGWWGWGGRVALAD